MEAIQAGFALEVQKLGARFRALRRLAGVLQVAGASISLPNPASLIPVDLIDINKYQELSALCPGLLPPYTGQTLDTLKATLEDAYLALLNRSLTHPWSKMAELQGLIDAQITSLADRVASVVGPAIDINTCIAAICGAIEQGGVLGTSADLSQTTAEYDQLIASAEGDAP